MEARSVLERAAQPLTGLSAATFAALSRARGARFFHPVGHVFPGRIDWDAAASDWLPAPLLRARPEAEVVVRFSRGLGLPEPLPDFLGIAVKIRDAYGPAHDQDWLLVSSGRDPLTRHSLIPSPGFSSLPYSTVLPYRWKDQLVTFAAFAESDNASARTLRDLVRAAREGRLAFRLAVAPEGRAHTEIGRVSVNVPTTMSGAARFNPWNTSPELKPAGALNELRRRTYQESQRARPDG